VQQIWSSTSDSQAPKAPAFLELEDTTTTLSWTASADNLAVTGYEIYQGTTLKEPTLELHIPLRA
jgi:hypothetical protein